MEQTNIPPGEVLNALLNKGPRSQKAANLKALHDICADQYAMKNLAIRDFSLPAIGRLCEAKGVFKARVLYNAASEDYVALIKAWSAFSGAPSIKPPKKEAPPPAAHAYLMRIEDPALRSIMQSVIVERDKLKSQVALLKSTSQIVVNQRPLGATIAPGAEGVPIIEIGAQLTSSESDALNRAISKDFLTDQGWSIGQDGEIVTTTGRTLFEPGFVTALHKVLSHELNTPYPKQRS
jgi:hypothetical protein